MPGLFEDLSDRFSDLHVELEKALDGLSSEALDWVPGPEMNSIAVLVIHLIGAERYWIGVAVNEPPDRDRDSEFQTKGLSAAALKALLGSADICTRETLARFALPDLEGDHLSPRNAKTYPTGWCLFHALEHTALHTGHIELTRQLWDLRTKVPRAQGDHKGKS